MCYKPQIRMRLIYTGYAINAALVCFVLTCALMCYDEHSYRFQYVVHCITDYMFIIFGPVLFTFCIMGFSCLPGLVQDCKPNHVGEITHPADITVLVLCTIVSFCVLFLYAAQITAKVANIELANEYSFTYVTFASCFKREKDRYQVEKNARYAMLKREEDDEYVFNSDDDEEGVVHHDDKSKLLAPPF